MAKATPSVTRSGKLETFAYTPPGRIYRTVRVLFALAAGADPRVYAAVLRGIWRFSPLTRALVTAHPGIKDWMLGANMGVVDLDSVPLRPYLPAGTSTARPVMASHLFMDCDGCIAVNSVSADTLDLPPSLAAMAEFARGTTDLKTVYLALKPCFAGAVVQVGDQVVWGDDILDVDATAFRLAGKPAHSILTELRSVTNEPA